MIDYNVQGLRRPFEPLPRWPHHRTTSATEVALEWGDREAAVMPCPLQDTQRDHTAGTRLELNPLGTRLPALYAPLVLTGAAHCLNVGADRYSTPHRHERGSAGR